jgi:hypothetical protein
VATSIVRYTFFFFFVFFKEQIQGVLHLLYIRRVQLLLLALYSFFLETGIAQLVQRRATGRTAWVRFPTGTKGFVFFTASRPALRLTQPPIQWVSEAISPGLKWLEREADHSPHLVPRSRIKELYLHSLVCLHGVGLN